MYKILAACWGLLLWGAATVALRTYGHHFFRIEGLWLLTGTFLAAAPLIALVTYPFYGLLRLRSTDRVAAAALMALPGMLLDVLSVLFFTRAFPNLDPNADAAFGAWLLWAYALTLITGFWPGKAEPLQN